MNDTQAQIILQSPAQTSAANPQTGGSFNFPVIATLGTNSVTLSAVDRAGNAATATTSFTFQAILGKLETISCDNLTGYALTTGNLAQSIQVEVLVNGQLFTTLTAAELKGPGSTSPPRPAPRPISSASHLQYNQFLQCSVY